MAAHGSEASPHAPAVGVKVACAVGPVATAAADFRAGDGVAECCALANVVKWMRELMLIVCGKMSAVLWVGVGVCV